MTDFHRPQAVLFTVILALLIPTFAAAGEGDRNGAFPLLDEVMPVIAEEDLQTLLEDGELLRFHPDGVSPGLLPETGFTAAVARQMISANLNIGIEGLFFTPADELPAGFAEADSGERRLILYNIMRSVSTLEGLEYFSASRGEMRLLFEESWTVADPKSKDPLPDPLVTSIPEEDAFYIHQKDKSFGKNIQLMDYRVSDEAMAVDIVNQTPMRYKGLIRVVDPENMQIHLIVVPVEEGILIYGTMSAQTRNVKAFLDRARNSFTNRVVALAGWYNRRLTEEF